MERGFPGGGSGKEPSCQWRRHQRCRFDPWVKMIPWRRAWQPTTVILPGKFHGQRSLAGYSPWGHKQMDTTERLSTHKDTRTHTPYFCFSRNSSDFTAVIKIVRELGGLRQKTM